MHKQKKKVKVTSQPLWRKRKKKKTARSDHLVSVPSGPADIDPSRSKPSEIKGSVKGAPQWPLDPHIQQFETSRGELEAVRERRRKCLYFPTAAVQGPADADM